MKGMFEALFGTLAGPLFLVLGFGVLFVTFRAVNVDLLPVLTYILLFSPLWIPITLFFILHERWIDSVRLKFEEDSGRVTLRIRLPQEVRKSPEAMENVLNQIWNTGKPANLMEAYLDGKTALIHSFEIISHGGEVRFYVNVPVKKAKNLIESQLYAQYPGIEVSEMEIDYTSEITWDPNKWNLMSFHFGKKEEEVFPIKTYVDYKLDQNPKDEETVEPLAPLLEYLSNAEPHERVWVQILAKPHSKQDFSTGSLSKESTWDSKAPEIISNIIKKDQYGTTSDETPKYMQLSESKKDLVKSIERNTSKVGYETIIRIIYAAPPDKFSGEMITAMIRAMASFDIIGRNGIGIRWRTDFDYNFISDFGGKRRPYYKRKELDFYKARNYVPFAVSSGADKMKVFSTEELATLWHIPGKSILTPSLDRVEALRQDAPANLPIGNNQANWG